jgi:hypothetical protein
MALRFIALLHVREYICTNSTIYIINNNKVNVNECGVIDLDDSRGMGTHWCCWFKRGREKYYFDSYGLQPPNELFNI